MVSDVPLVMWLLQSLKNCGIGEEYVGKRRVHKEEYGSGVPTRWDAEGKPNDSFGRATIVFDSSVVRQIICRNTDERE